jgi:hypothetical protein
MARLMIALSIRAAAVSAMGRQVMAWRAAMRAPEGAGS